MSRVTWVRAAPGTLGVTATDIPQTKGALIAWRKSDGASSTILTDYGLHPLDWDLATESVRDKLVMNEFAKWWNAQNYSPTLSVVPNTAAPGFPTNAALDFNDYNVAAVKVWATGKANIPTGPPSLPQGTYPPPPGWPQGVPFPPPAPPGWPAGVPFPPLGSSAPAGWPSSIPYPPPAPTGWPSNFPFPIQIPSGWTNPPQQPANPPPSNPPPPPPPSQQPPQPPPAAPGGTVSAPKSNAILWVVGAVVLGGIALLASGGGARVSNPTGPLLPNGPGDVDDDAARELQLYLDNDSRFSPDAGSGKGRAIRDNLKKKWAKGTYDRMKAIDGWMYVVDDAAKAYAKEVGGGTWHHIFNAPTRRRVATELEAYGRQAFESGEW